MKTKVLPVIKTDVTLEKKTTVGRRGGEQMGEGDRVGIVGARKLIWIKKNSP